MPALFRSACLLTLLLAAFLDLSAQTRPAFEVASIKPNVSRDRGAFETLPDGTFKMINAPLLVLILETSPGSWSLDQLVGMPDWVMQYRYDVIAKPPAGAPADQQKDMLRNLLAERMKLVSHIEERERDTYALTIDRPDRRLGPSLKPSTIDCSPGGTGHKNPEGARSKMEAFQNRCGVTMGPGYAVSGGTTIERFALSLKSLVGRYVVDRTGLQGDYAWSLQFAPPPQRGAEPVPSDAPDIMTAVREQLGLRLQPEKNKVPHLVIDHIERPSPD